MRPRQIDPSIHPGLSAVVMKALAKEPEARYQTCREMLEDLKNYRALTSAENPQSTMGMSGSPEATVVVANPRAGRADDAQAANMVRALHSRAASPMQTPAVRRTAAIEPVEPPRKKNLFLTVFLGLLLVGIIVFGFQKIRPEFEAARQQNQTQKAAVVEKDSATTPSGEGAVAATTDKPAAVPEKAPEKSVSEPPAEAKPIVTKKADSGLTAATAEYKGRIEEAAAERGLTKRLKIRGTGNTLTLSGKLRPSEHGELLKLLKAAPAGVQVVDDILYDDTPVNSGGSAESGSHPVPTAGHGAIHVITNVVGATAVVTGSGMQTEKCETPCGFASLPPGSFNLEVKKNGFQPMQTTLQIRAGQTLDQKITLEALSLGLHIKTKPAGADVFINGAKQSGQTPVTLPLAPGSYNLVLRLQGYDPYSEQVFVKEDIQTLLDLEMKEKSTYVAWAQVETTPAGAEILVDGVSTGKQSPARVEITSGIHVIVLKLNGYQVARRSVQVSEGGTVTIGENLRQK